MRINRASSTQDSHPLTIFSIYLESAAGSSVEILKVYLNHLFSKELTVFENDLK